MSFANYYFTRFKTENKIFDNPCSKKTGIIVIIPCYNDSHIIETLNSLDNTDSIITNNIEIEIIVAINSGEDASNEIKKNNKDVYTNLNNLIENKHFKKIKLLAFYRENIPKKIAGVGFARKLAMDEALRRFNEIENPDGLIISLDADCLVNKSYFNVLYNKFYLNKKNRVCTFQFSHDFNTNLYEEKIIESCKKYEMYLRYFRLSLEYCKFPNSVHTIGSCFGVKALDYAKAGGMSTKQGGEDFYFLQKIASQVKIEQINDTLVFPSPRISDRVPFGTGQTVRKIYHDEDYMVFNFKLFQILKSFYSVILEDTFFENFQNLSEIPKMIIEFIGDKNLRSKIVEAKLNCSNPESLKKRLILTFDAFFIIKFLNFAQSKYNAFRPVKVENAVKELLETFGINNVNDFDELFSTIEKLDKGQLCIKNSYMFK